MMNVALTHTHTVLHFLGLVTKEEELDDIGGGRKSGLKCHVAGTSMRKRRGVRGEKGTRGKGGERTCVCAFPTMHWPENQTLRKVKPSSSSPYPLLTPTPPR